MGKQHSDLDDVVETRPARLQDLRAVCERLPGLGLDGVAGQLTGLRVGAGGSGDEEE